MRTSDFNYHLPPEQIAQHPADPRDSSRLMVYERSTGNLIHDRFFNVMDYLESGDVLVLNQTKVIPARVYGHKKRTGGKIEVLLLKKIGPQVWNTIVGGKGLVAGVELAFPIEIEAEVIEVGVGPERTIRFDREIEPYLFEIGEMPLPPYISETLNDPSEYQTVFARVTGSAAAPTAGLHFTDELLSKIKEKGVEIEYVTLHVGLDTFAPVKEDDPEEHHIHTEWCSLSGETVDRLNRIKEQGGRVIAVGTTSVRTLETAARAIDDKNRIGAYEGPTDLFILPGYKFRYVDAMITNFHLPQSTLLMLVSAFAGRENILDLYEKAIRDGYRFYSFGDAMLLL